MKRVYRVENAGGWGIYRGRLSDGTDTPAARSGMGNGGGKRHPEPPHDEGFIAQGVAAARPFWFDVGEGRFAFASLEQLRFWIYRKVWRTRLEAEGFKIGVYDCPDKYAVLGETQAIFAKARATHVEDLKLSEV